MEFMAKDQVYTIKYYRLFQILFKNLQRMGVENILIKGPDPHND